MGTNFPLAASRGQALTKPPWLVLYVNPIVKCLKTPPGVSVVLSCRWKTKMLRHEEAVLKALKAPSLVQRGWGEVCKKMGLCQEGAQEQSDAGRKRQLSPGARGLQPCNQATTRTWAFFALQEGRVQGSQLQSNPKESSCRHPRQ